MNGSGAYEAEDGPAQKAPLRLITEHRLSVAVCGFMEGTQYYYWDIRLECGHRTDRPCKYKPGGERGWGRIWHGSGRSNVLPFAQKRARCWDCA